MVYRHWVVSRPRYKYRYSEIILITVMSDRDPLKNIIGTCAAQIGAYATPILSPLIIGGLIIGLNIGEVDAGSLITVELLVIGISGMLVAPFMGRISHRLLAMTGALLLVCGHAFSIESTELSQLYVWRILAGIGGGLLTATVNAAIARAKSPTRLYGLAWAAGYMATAILALLVTSTNDVVVYSTVYSYLLVTVLIVLPLMWLLPTLGALEKNEGFASASIASGCLLMLGIILIGISMMSYYAFLGQLRFEFRPVPQKPVLSWHSRRLQESSAAYRQPRCRNDLAN